jgi:hypothetical protein
LLPLKGVLLKHITGLVERLPHLPAEILRRCPVD